MENIARLVADQLHNFGRKGLALESLPKGDAKSVKTPYRDPSRGNQFCKLALEFGQRRLRRCEEYESGRSGAL